MTFSEFTYISILFSNDLKFIKLHATGYSADELRLIANSLAIYTETTADEFSKLAIMKQEGVDSFSNVKNYIDESVWKPETDEVYTMDKFVQFINTKGRDYLDSIKELKKIDPENPEILNIESFWTEEIEYKNASRMLKEVEDTKEPQGDAINPDTTDAFANKEENTEETTEGKDEEKDDSKESVFTTSLENVINDYVSFMSDVTEKKEIVDNTIDYVQNLIKGK